MRKLRIFEHISVDGIIAPPGDDEYANGGWMSPYRCADGRDAILSAQGPRFDLLLGRRTYDMWSGYWPKAPSGPFADPINAATKYVATHRPDSLTWGPVQALGPDLAAGVRAAKSAAGPDLILWGSSTLTSALLEEGLVDEVALFIYPVVLGAGKRCFRDGMAPRELALVSSKPTSTGALVNLYRYVGAPKRAS